MKLHTNIPLSKQSNNLIDYKSKCLLLGSCFSEHIGEKFTYFKFQSLQNPFGILFHPLAIENLIKRAINTEFYNEEDLIFHNERWHCFDAHSCLSSNEKDELLNNLNNAIKATHQYINKSTHIIITLGTAWYYRFNETDKIVANCHKVPQKKFLKELLSTVKISDSLKAIIELIRTVNSNASVLFTVSPVRHLKDGFIENQRSKAHLISAIHDIVESQNICFYFPSYEMMMDELRDYRFYNADMVHPNQLAVNYIWEKFKSVWIASDSEEVMKTIDDIQKGLAHKPFNPDSKKHNVFKETLKVKIEKLTKKYPQINF